MSILFALALLVLVGLAVASSTCRLQKLVALLVAGFTLSNVLFAMDLPGGWLMAALAVADLLSAWYIIQIMPKRGTATFMTVLALYVIMSLAHGAFWRLGAGVWYVATLNSLFSAQLLVVGWGLVARINHLRERTGGFMALGGRKT